MKNREKILSSFLAGVFLFASVNTFATTTAAVTSEIYTLDPLHTAVLWHINHLGFSVYSGKWFIHEGSLFLDPTHPEKSHVNANILMKDVDTGNSELNEHLEGPAFFDVSRYPMATFKSTKVKLTGEKTANVYGVLTLHNISKPILLNVSLNKVGVNFITDKPSVGFSATTSIKRSDFGLTTLLPMLSDQVDIEIEAEGSKK